MLHPSLSSAADASSFLPPSLHPSVPLWPLLPTLTDFHTMPAAHSVSICARRRAFGSAVANTKISPTPTRFTPKLPEQGRLPPLVPDNEGGRKGLRRG